MLLSNFSTSQVNSEVKEYFLLPKAQDISNKKINITLNLNQGHTE